MFIISLIGFTVYGQSQFDMKDDIATTCAAATMSSITAWRVSDGQNGWFRNGSNSRLDIVKFRRHNYSLDTTTHLFDGMQKLSSNPCNHPATAMLYPHTKRRKNQTLLWFSLFRLVHSDWGCSCWESQLVTMPNTSILNHYAQVGKERITTTFLVSHLHVSLQGSLLFSSDPSLSKARSQPMLSVNG